MSLLRIVAVIGVAVLAGCAHYYKVTDPGSGKSYYTTEVNRSGGAVVFKDAQTGAETTMQNSQVLEIDKDQFQKGVGTPQK
jgi:hypothetical protein